MQIFSIEIQANIGQDPQKILTNILEGTGIFLSRKPDRIDALGVYEWIIPEQYNEDYSKNREKIKKRLTEHFYKGTVKYATW